MLKRDYSYFCNNELDIEACETSTVTHAWTLAEKKEKRDNIICPHCKKNMLIDISVRAVNNNPAQGASASMESTFDFETTGSGKSFF